MPMHVEQLRYTRSLLLKPPPRGLGVETSLKHFAIVTYYVDSPSIQAHLHPRFEPVCLLDDNGSRQALISVVTFSTAISFCHVPVVEVELRTNKLSLLRSRH